MLLGGDRLSGFLWEYKIEALCPHFCVEFSSSFRINNNFFLRMDTSGASDGYLLYLLLIIFPYILPIIPNCFLSFAQE